MKRIDRLTISVEPVIDHLSNLYMGCTRLRFRIWGEGKEIGYDQIVDQSNYTKSIFDHMFDSAKMKIEESFFKPAQSDRDREGRG